jgi:hypothetical protein
MQSECKANAKRMQSDVKATATPLHSERENESDAKAMAR